MKNETRINIKDWVKYPQMKRLIKYAIGNYTSGELNDPQTRNKLKQEQNRKIREAIAEIFLNEIEEKTTRKVDNARREVAYILNRKTFNIKELAPQNPHAKEEQVILTLCYVAVTLETELIRDMYNENLYKKNGINSNLYNDVLRSYYRYQVLYRRDKNQTIIKQ